MKQLILLVFLLGSIFTNAQIEITLDVGKRVNNCFINKVDGNNYRPHEEYVTKGSQITVYVEEYGILLKPMDFEIRDTRDMEISTNIKATIEFKEEVLMFHWLE
jgi:hypothetical protein